MHATILTTRNETGCDAKNQCGSLYVQDDKQTGLGADVSPGKPELRKAS